MRLTAENKEKITKRILAGAAQEFRARGFEAVNIDQVMKTAGLTRGAFYAHFKSKEDLFAAVMRHEHPVYAMLVRRDGETPDTLHRQMVEIFDGYLDPANLEEVFVGCSLAALTGDTVRQGAEPRRGYEAAWREILEEMARAQSQPAEAYSSALVLATGAVRSARAMESEAARAEVLRQAHTAFQHLLPGPRRAE